MISNEKQIIKGFANKHGYSDVEPYEVLRTISETTVEIRAMRVSDNKTKMNFLAGGFSGHCSNNRQQSYDYFSEPKNLTIRIRWSRQKCQWRCKHGNNFMMSDEAYKYYDFNF